MIGRRLVYCWIIMLGGVNSLFSQTVSLTENKKNVYFHVQMQLNLTGAMKLRQGKKDILLNVKAAAKHDFYERILDADEFGVKRSARHYHVADATITIEKDRLQRELRKSHRLIAAQRVAGQTVTYCPKGPLTREELELTEHLDTLAIPGLLPNRKTSVGDTWKIPNNVVQSMCSLDGVTGHDLQGKLDNATATSAQISISGTVNGIDMGAAVKLTVKAELRFDRKRECITSVVWKQEDEREQGPASPALTANVSVTLKRTPAAAVNELNDFAIVPIPSEAVPPKRLTNVIFRDDKGRFTMQHDRNWHVTARTEKHIVFRLMDRGDFVAQATLSPWAKAKPGEHTSPDEFRDAMEEIPGWEAQQTLDKGSEIKSDKGYWIYRVGASGQMEGVDVVQYFYLAANAGGRQFVVTFTMTPTQAQKLNTRDVTLVRNLTILGK